MYSLYTPECYKVKNAAELSDSDFKYFFLFLEI